MKKSLLLLFFIFRLCTNVIAQGGDYYDPTFLRYENHVYNKNIISVIFEQSGVPLSDPVINLGSSEKLTLTFDDLGEEVSDYSYKIIHCDRNWQPSALSESDFTGGFYTDHIANYKQSFNTIQHYFHFKLEFPNENLSPLISGNYLLVVFDNSDPDKIVLTRRFWVVENIASIETNIHRATEIELRNTHQEVDIKVNTGSLKIGNPYSDAQLVIVQNNNQSMAISDLKPQFVLDKELDYNYDEGNVFQGGNEFRNFDIRTIRFKTQYIEDFSMDPASKITTVELKPDQRRGTQRYSTEDDLNGRYLIKVYEGRDGDLEGDYLKVKFKLPVLEPFENGQIYIFGQLTNWEITPEAKMQFDVDNNQYINELYLKQGYYNYEYLFVPNSSKKPEIAETEGQHFETRNDYSIFFYTREPGTRYDKLSGYRRTGN
jgi:hypothetical protein